jgi:hypothetical protein
MLSMIHGSFALGLQTCKRVMGSRLRGNDGSSANYRTHAKWDSRRAAAEAGNDVPRFVVLFISDRAPPETRSAIAAHSRRT